MNKIAHFYSKGRGGGMGFIFEDLRVYQKALATAKEILGLMTDIPRAHSALADQLRRAAMSVPANLAEGCGRWHPKAKRNFYRIALGSVYECIPFIDFAYAQKIIDETQHLRFKESFASISKMIIALIESTT